MLYYNINLLNLKWSVLELQLYNYINNINSKIA